MLEKLIVLNHNVEGDSMYRRLNDKYVFKCCYRRFDGFQWAHPDLPAHFYVLTSKSILPTISFHPN